jgi:ABC-type multidrug transport system ATPase subunit
MGPSGCGKTTLLNVLARRTAASRAKVFGDTYVNGDKLDLSIFGRITSYVEQEDALIGSLTVRETLKFAADLSLPRCAHSEFLRYCCEACWYRY